MTRFSFCSGGRELSPSPTPPAGRGPGFDPRAMPALAELREALYGVEGERQVTTAVLNQLDARGLAVWYGDDGSFGGSHRRYGKGEAMLYNKSLSGESRVRVA